MYKIFIYILTTYMDDLKIVRAGKSGTGILIEQDSGYISPNDNKTFINEITNLEQGKSLDTKSLIVYVVLQKYGVLNRNGRIYPEKILKIQAEAYQQLIKERRAVGELDHPESSIISADRVSHNIIKMWWEQHTLMGQMEIIMSPAFINQGIISCKGDIAANLLKNNIMIGVSSRGVGSLQEDRNGHQIVQDDFELLGWDIVTGPSTPGSWMMKDKQNIQQFVENEVKKKPLLNNGLDKFLL